MHVLSPLRLLCATGFLARFSYALARNPILPLFALYLGAGPEVVGLVVGVSTVTGIFFKLPSGALSDVIGRRKTLLAGLAVFALMPFAYLAVRSTETLIVVRFLHGLATAIYGPVVMAVVAEAAGARKGETLSLFSSVTIVGALCGAPVGGFLLYLGAGGDMPALWNYLLVFGLSGLSGAAALVLGWRATRGLTARPSGGGFGERAAVFWSGVREVLSDKRVVAASSMEGVQNMAMGALEAFLPIYAVTVAGLNEFQAGLLWAGQIVTTLLAKPLLGRFSDRHGRRGLIVVGMAACAAPFAAIPHLTDFWTLLAACLVFGLGEALVTSSSAAMVADICRERHFGAAMGAFGTIFDVGHASGPILGGALVAALGYAPAFAILAAILVAVIPVFLRVVQTEASAPRDAT